MRFTKMHGCGNDYVYVDCFREDISAAVAPALARRVSDRHFGIGSDGLILIRPSAKADCFMEMYNADGSQSAMCGNGIRCVGKFIHDAGIAPRGRVAIDTLAGVRTLDLQVESGVCVGATVDMGEPILSPDAIPTTLGTLSAIDRPLEALGREWRLTCVSMGNPHATIVVEDFDSLPFYELGPAIERHPAFPERTNVHFIKQFSRTHFAIRTWERGSGETLACGTGNCAALVAATLLGLTDGEADMDCAGGRLHIRWDRGGGYDHPSNHVFMTGPAETVFVGEIDL